MKTFLPLLPWLLATLPTTHASPPSFSLPVTRHKRPPAACPPLEPAGDRVVTFYQLYPENADWDASACRLWIGSVFNATAAVYDPYTDRVTSVLAFPTISHTGSVHIGGVGWDHRTGLVSILANSARPWETAGADVSGERELIKWDPAGRGRVLWRVDLARTSRDRYGGFQDVEHDAWGRTYVVGTWPGTILRIDERGHRVTELVVPEPLPPTTVKGYSGIAVVKETGSREMLAVDGDGRLKKFDLARGKGRVVDVPIRPEVLYNDTDAIYLPPVYEGRVLLVASLFSGIQVLRSKDRRWRTAEYLGTIPIPQGELYEGGNTVATVQMGTSVFMVIGFIFDPWVTGTVAGNRTQFPFPDITEDIEKLLRE
ncbi:hypothetical protein MMYC01_206629 [Madurella mycetomatis]|uniref:Uncharacterized protein n=1 Tax=Madurella mycetomatis TaxID=100816 RepID=A0A175VYL8_9PEZI|nr:hypothetical protein MMYC01_206629 [Madurella mycetomatis]